MKAYKAEHPTTHFYAFDSFVVDEGKSVLLREGQSVPLTPKAFEILLVLVRNPGRVLKKEELIDQVWPDAFVDENNLPRNSVADNVGTHRSVEIIAYGEADSERGSARVNQSL